MNEWTGANNGRTDGAADGGTNWRTGGRADGGGRADDGFPKGKTPNLTHQLTWPSEIQRGRPRVTVKLFHLPPPSR